MRYTFSLHTVAVCFCTFYLFLNDSLTDILKPDNIFTFEMSTNQNSHFYITNELWKMMSQ